MIRKITSFGKYTLGISIPKTILSKLRWRKGQKVVVGALKDKIQIQDYPNKK